MPNHAPLAPTAKSPMLILRDRSSTRPTETGMELEWRFKYAMNTKGKLAYIGSVYAVDMAEAKFKAINQLLARGAHADV
jgi:hypothetical protein